MIDTYLILKLDEASAETDQLPTLWIQMAEVEPKEDYASPQRVLNEWLAETQPSATAAGTYLVVAGQEEFRCRRFTVTPRVEWDVEETKVRLEAVA